MFFFVLQRILANINKRGMYKLKKEILAKTLAKKSKGKKLIVQYFPHGLLSKLVYIRCFEVNFKFVLLKKKILIIFLVFFNYFDMLISKINFKKIKNIYYFNIFLK